MTPEERLARSDAKELMMGEHYGIGAHKIGRYPSDEELQGYLEQAARDDNFRKAFKYLARAARNNETRETENDEV